MDLTADVLAYMELGIVGIAQCLIIYYKMRDKAKETEQTEENKESIIGHTYGRIIWITIGILLLDTITYFMRSQGVLENVAWVIALLEVYVHIIGETFVAYELLLYYIYISGNRLRKREKLLLAIPFDLIFVGLQVNVFITNTEGMLSQKYKLVMGAVSIGYLLVGAGYTYIRYLYAEEKSKNITFYTFIFAFLTMIICLVGRVVVGFSIWTLFALNIVFLYLNVQSKREEQLGTLAFKDALTGLKNSTAYKLKVEGLEEKIKENKAEFGVVVFDVNNLKIMNDTYGHKAGDDLIVSAGKYICRIFSHSPVYRTGGDEFVCILENNDYKDRDILLLAFDKQIKKEAVPISEANAVLPLSIARGLAVYTVENKYAEVFKIADNLMYRHKKKIKQEMKAEIEKAKTESLEKSNKINTDNIA